MTQVLTGLAINSEPVKRWPKNLIQVHYKFTIIEAMYNFDTYVWFML